LFHHGDSLEVGMAGQVTLRGRFSAGTVVRLVRVAHEGVLRAEGGEEVDVQTAEKDENGVASVSFKSGVDEGARYIATGISDGRPLDVRVRGRSADDPSEILEQPPIQPDRVRLTDGSWSDQAPTKESAPKLAFTAPGQHQVPDGVTQRSDTLRGSAHPVDVESEEPVRRQESVKEGTPQMSDTRPREVDGVQVGGGGEATEIVLGPQRQEDVPDGVLQRSDTPTGVAQPLPGGDMVKAQLDRDSSRTRESRGDNTRGAAEPIDVKGAKLGPPRGANEKQSLERQEESLAARTAPRALDQPADVRVNQSGLDAMGQPVYEDVARAAGVESADAPGDPYDSGPDPARVEAGRKAARVEAGRKAARTRARNAARTRARNAASSGDEK
jgi:hypothetical protein